jgi:BirA family biotin operon repressor/biotin-[acetyl-CoA-carboxylase] ligase
MEGVLNVSYIRGLVQGIPCNLIGGGVTGSTNDDAKKLAAEAAAEGTVVLAARQTAGRGRLGRTWVSPEGGVYLSFVLRPQCPPESLAHLSLVVGIAVRQALAGLGCDDAMLKWPNDVLLKWDTGDGDRCPETGKVCGILTETVLSEVGIEAVIVGIGVNVNRGPDAYPGSAYVSDVKGTIPPEVAAAMVIRAVLRTYGAWRASDYRFAPFHDEYLAHLTLLDQNVRVSDLDGTVLAQGRVAGIDEQGRLIVGGKSIIAGDVTLK